MEDFCIKCQFHPCKCREMTAEKAKKILKDKIDKEKLGR
jgi:hypothetical protein